MKRPLISILLAMCLTLNGFSVAQAGKCQKKQLDQVSLPPNLILPGHAKAMVGKVWRRSPTFRLQCERLSRAQWLRVKLRFVSKPSFYWKYRALTTVNKRSGLATIEIYRREDYVELIGHEFEHVLEQIEGVNLATLVAEKSGQAYNHESGVFETERALGAGGKVKAEYKLAKSSNGSAGDPCSTRMLADVTPQQSSLKR